MRGHKERQLQHSHQFLVNVRKEAPAPVSFPSPWLQEADPGGPRETMGHAPLGSGVSAVCSLSCSAWSRCVASLRSTPWGGWWKA